MATKQFFWVFVQTGNVQVVSFVCVTIKTCIQLFIKLDENLPFQQGRCPQAPSRKGQRFILSLAEISIM